MNGTARIPAPSLRELSAKLTEGVSPDEWWNVKILSFVGAMKIARNVAAFGRHVEWYSPHSGSLPEGAGSPIGLTEGVSFVGSTGLMAYSPAHIDSEIFERLRASGDTPSVSLSLDSSLREGAGKRSHSSGYSLNRKVAGDFHRPYGGRLPFIGVLANVRGWRVIFIAPTDGVYHSSGYSLKSGVTGDFHRPYGGRLPFNRVLAKIRGYGRFSSPLRRAFTVHRGAR